MKPEPKIDHFLESDEQALISAIESESYQPGHSILDRQRLELLQAAARATINEQRTKISLRLPNSDLSRLKARALQEGVPYQTLINSLLHKAVSS